MNFIKLFVPIGLVLLIIYLFFTDEKKELNIFDSKKTQIQKELEGLKKIDESFERMDRQIEIKLDQIKLPSNLDKQSVENYVEKILVISDKQSRWGNDDPQIAMLLKLDKKYIPILLDAFGIYGNPRHKHLIPVLNVMVDETHKNLIIETFRKKVDLIHVIANKGWVEDVKDVVCDILNKSPNWVPAELIDIVVPLNDSYVDKGVVNYFIKGINKQHTYEALLKSKNINLDDAVKKAWIYANQIGDDRSIGSLAPIMAKHGHVEGVEVMVDRLVSDDVHREIYDYREVLAELIDYTSLKSDYISWLEDNVGQMKYDVKLKKYIVTVTRNNSSDTKNPK